MPPKPVAAFGISPPDLNNAMATSGGTIRLRHGFHADDKLKDAINRRSRPADDPDKGFTCHLRAFGPKAVQHNK